MTATTARVRAHRERRLLGLVDDVATLMAEAPESAVRRALAAVGPAALESLRAELSGASTAASFTNLKREA